MLAPDCLDLRMLRAGHGTKAPSSPEGRLTGRGLAPSGEIWHGAGLADARVGKTGEKLGYRFALHNLVPTRTEYGGRAGGVEAG